MIKTVKQACRFNPVIQDYRMSQGIENLADLINDAGDGRDFFTRNFVTHGMEQLFREGLLRLSGKSDQAVFELTQAMGGGKTHMMIALGLLARHPHLRPEVLAGDLNARVDFGQARIAAFNGRNNPDNYLWGEIASQLGEEEAIKPYWVNGPKAVDQRKWKEIIGDTPTLILLDELPPYLDNASTQVFGQGTLANMVVYSLSSLMSAALELPNCGIVMANLSGSYKAQTKTLGEAISNLQQETRRQAMTITPVQLAGNEIYEILKKRLIDELPDDRVIADIADEYAQQIKKAENGGYIVVASLEQIAEQVRETEMIDKLAIPCARWDTLRKVWLDTDERIISPAGREQIAKCPLRIGIVSTGLMMRDSMEKQHLLGLRFGLVILDEAHKARSRQGFGKDAGTPNELLAFMWEIAARSDHVLLGTATPIQTQPEDLWDLMGILHQGKGNFVLGHDFALWHRPHEVLPILAGEQEVSEPSFAWQLLRSPLPLVDSTQEPRARKLFSAIRQDLGLVNGEWQTTKTLTELTEDTREILEDELDRRISGATLFQRENPLVHHIVLRKRVSLEEAGLLAKVGVDVHPDRQLVGDPHWFDVLFEAKALRTTENFREAYREARLFGKALGKSGKGGGFMKNLMEQRICSSIQAGLTTARILLDGRTLHQEEDEQEADLTVDTSEEREVLARLIRRLERIEEDPKLNAVIHYLEREKWLELGVIIFSQYYDTAKWVADELAARYPDEAIGLYAGAGRSRLYQRGESVTCERETLKKMVAEHEIRIMVATDAACEGLNLQTLGTLINIDLPWNPTRLEQRIGRIKRFGQKRETVDMLNLVNEKTVDEKIYDRLSERMRNRYDLFGSLPDTIKDEWIEDIESLGEKMDEFINAQKEATGFDLRYTSTMAPPEKDWRDCSQVLSRRDFAMLMSTAWNG